MSNTSWQQYKYIVYSVKDKYSVYNIHAQKWQSRDVSCANYKSDKTHMLIVFGNNPHACFKDNVYVLLKPKKMLMSSSYTISEGNERVLAEIISSSYHQSLYDNIPIKRIPVDAVLQSNCVGKCQLSMIKHKLSDTSNHMKLPILRSLVKRQVQIYVENAYDLVGKFLSSGHYDGSTPNLLKAWIHANLLPSTTHISPMTILKCVILEMHPSSFFLHIDDHRCIVDQVLYNTIQCYVNVSNSFSYLPSSYPMYISLSPKKHWTPFTVNCYRKHVNINDVCSKKKIHNLSFLKSFVTKLAQGGGWVKYPSFGHMVALSTEGKNDNIIELLFELYKLINNNDIVLQPETLDEVFGFTESLECAQVNSKCLLNDNVLLPTNTVKLLFHQLPNVSIGLIYAALMKIARCLFE